MFDAKPLYEAVLTGQAVEAKAITEQALAAGVNAQELVDTYMIPAMDEVGRRFERNDYFVPELLIAARAMKAALEVLKPALAVQGARSAGRVAIGTVKGDLHDIGKNLVMAMLEGGGFDVVDLGVDVTPAKFIEAARSSGATILGLSALLTTTMTSMKAVIEGLEREGLRDRVKVMIGGAPVTQKYADEIGADGYSDSAAGAVLLARKLVGETSGRQ